MRTRHVFLIAVLGIALCIPASAADAYLVRFHAYGHATPSGSGQVLWMDDVLFFNSNTDPAVVHFLGVSNGAPQVEPPPLNLPPGHVVSLNSNIDVAEKWQPRPLPSLYILHLDVPAGVVVESRDDFYLLYADVPELFPVPLGKVSIPVFRELAPAGTRQIQLGTDLNANSSRVNVSIYNAGSESASATVEVRRTCDDSVTETRSLTIPPNTVVQTNGMQAGGATCTGFALNSQWTRYTVVTVSQPSATFVSNVNETVTPPPGADGVAPIVGLAVSHNSKF